MDTFPYSRNIGYPNTDIEFHTPLTPQECYVRKNSLTEHLWMLEHTYNFAARVFEELGRKPNSITNRDQHYRYNLFATQFFLRGDLTLFESTRLALESVNVWANQFDSFMNMGFMTEFEMSSNRPEQPLRYRARANIISTLQFDGWHDLYHPLNMQVRVTDMWGFELTKPLSYIFVESSQQFPDLITLPFPQGQEISMPGYSYDEIRKMWISSPIEAQAERIIQAMFSPELQTNYDIYEYQT